LKVNKTTYIDYSAISTVVGWTSTTIKEIFYKVIDDLVMVTVSIDGTSNNTLTSITLPFNAAKTSFSKSSFLRNNGAVSASAGLIVINEGTNVLTFYNINNLTWSATNQKAVYLQFNYFKTT